MQCEIRDGALGSDRCDVKATRTVKVAEFVKDPQRVLAMGAWASFAIERLQSPDQCPCLGVHPLTFHSPDVLLIRVLVGDLCIGH